MRTSQLVFHRDTLALPPIATEKPKRSYEMQVAEDYTGLHIKVAHKHPLKGLRGTVINWHEELPKVNKLYEKTTDAERLAVAGKNAKTLKNRYELRFHPGRTAKDIEMAVMLTVRLEHRIKLDQIPGHLVVEAEYAVYLPVDQMTQNDFLQHTSAHISSSICSAQA